jgi:hypothetical protein
MEEAAMAGDFFYLGPSTAASSLKYYPDIDPTVGSTAYTHVDSANLSTVTLGPVASSALPDAYEGLGIYVIAGSGTGQLRQILRSNTAAQTVATVKEWDNPKPDSGSTLVVGVMLDGRDGFAVKAEHAGSGATGTFRGVFFSRDVPPRTVFTTSFTLGFVGSIAATAYLTMTTAAGHGETRVIDYLNPGYRLAKLMVDIAPTAQVELFGAAVFTAGRNPNR